MADITKLSTASLDLKSAQHVEYISALVAGEDLAVAAPCYIGSDGKVYQSVTSQTTISGISDVHGFAPATTVSGAVVTLFGRGARFSYASAMTPGQYLYASDTAGNLSDAAINEGDEPLAVAISTSDIFVVLK